MLYREARALELDVLVEIHDEEELEIALERRRRLHRHQQPRPDRLLGRPRPHVRPARRHPGGEDGRQGVGHRHAGAARGARPRRRRRGARRRAADACADDLEDAPRSSSRRPASTTAEATRRPETAFRRVQRALPIFSDGHEERSLATPLLAAMVGGGITAGVLLGDRRVDGADHDDRLAGAALRPDAARVRRSRANGPHRPRHLQAATRRAWCSSVPARSDQTQSPFDFYPRPARRTSHGLRLRARPRRLHPHQRPRGGLLHRRAGVVLRSPHGDGPRPSARTLTPTSRCWP